MFIVLNLYYATSVHSFWRRSKNRCMIRQHTHTPNDLVKKIFISTIRVRVHHIRTSSTCIVRINKTICNLRICYDRYLNFYYCPNLNNCLGLFFVFLQIFYFHLSRKMINRKKKFQWICFYSESNYHTEKSCYRISITPWI